MPPVGWIQQLVGFFTPHIRAAATMTLALPKNGLVVEPGRSACGDLYLADISVPPALYSHLGLDVPALFAVDPLVPLDIVENRAWVDTGRRCFTHSFAGIRSIDLT